MLKAGLEREIRPVNLTACNTFSFNPFLSTHSISGLVQGLVEGLNDNTFCRGFFWRAARCLRLSLDDKAGQDKVVRPLVWGGGPVRESALPARALPVAPRMLDLLQ